MPSPLRRHCSAPVMRIRHRGRPLGRRKGLPSRSTRTRRPSLRWTFTSTRSMPRCSGPLLRADTFTSTLCTFSPPPRSPCLMCVFASSSSVGVIGSPIPCAPTLAQCHFRASDRNVEHELRGPWSPSHTLMVSRSSSSSCLEALRALVPTAQLLLLDIMPHAERPRVTALTAMTSRNPSGADSTPAVSQIMYMLLC